MLAMDASPAIGPEVVGGGGGGGTGVFEIPFWGVTDVETVGCDGSITFGPDVVPDLVRPFATAKEARTRPVATTAVRVFMLLRRIENLEIRIALPVMTEGMVSHTGAGHPVIGML